ncbi:TPA: hypothetical protein ACH3X2_004493 [Trebouxia sp. C0005]
MHFRIPQALDSFVAAAVAGHVVSKPAFARAGAKTDLHSLQPHLRPQQARPQGYPGRQLDWSEDCCAEAYSMLCTVSAAGWPSRTLLLLLARFLSGLVLLWYKRQPTDAMWQRVAIHLHLVASQ